MYGLLGIVICIYTSLKKEKKKKEILFYVQFLLFHLTYDRNLSMSEYKALRYI